MWGTLRRSPRKMPGAQHAVPTEDNTTVLSPKEQLEQVAHYDRAASPQTPNQFHEGAQFATPPCDPAAAAPDATPEQWNQAISCPEDKALDSPLLPASAFQDCTPAPPEPEEVTWPLLPLSGVISPWNSRKALMRSRRRTA